MAKDSPAKLTTSAFTPNEQKIMSLAWQCFEGEPRVDYKKLARLCEMSNPVSASNAWSKIKKKLAAQAAENGLDGGGSDHGTPKPKGTMTMKRKKGGDVDGDADDEEVGTPSKKVRGGKGKVDEKFEDFEGQVNGTPVKVEDVEEEEEIVFS